MRAVSDRGKDAHPTDPAILTERLRLRPVREADLDALLALYTHPDVARWIGEHDRAKLEAEHARWQASDLPWWAVEERATGRLVGDGGLQPLEGRGPEVELGYDLHPDASGRGYATEVARAWLAYAWERGIDEVVAVVKPDHAASRRVLEKAGLSLMGPREAYGEPMLLYAARRA
jgi:RimJ/RimL family protein N-acetyltransferase